MTLRDLIQCAAAAGLCAAVSVGCAASPRESKAGNAPADGPAPTTVEEAQRDIDRSSAALGVREKHAPAPPPPPTQPNATGTASALPVPPLPDHPTTTSTPPPARTEALGTSSACASACRAIASLRRSVKVLCGLTGDDDARCSEAKAKLEDGERRVAACGC